MDMHIEAAAVIVVVAIAEWLASAEEPASAAALAAVVGNNPADLGPFGGMAGCSLADYTVDLASHNYSVKEERHIRCRASGVLGNHSGILVRYHIPADYYCLGYRGDAFVYDVLHFYEAIVDVFLLDFLGMKRYHLA